MHLRISLREVLSDLSGEILQTKAKEQQSLFIQFFKLLLFCIYKGILDKVTTSTSFPAVSWGKWGTSALIQVSDCYKKGVMSFHLSFWHQKISDPSSYLVYWFKIGLKYLLKRPSGSLLKHSQTGHVCRGITCSSLEV